LRPGNFHIAYHGLHSYAAIEGILRQTCFRNLERGLMLKMTCLCINMYSASNVYGF